MFVISVAKIVDPAFSYRVSGLYTNMVEVLVLHHSRDAIVPEEHLDYDERIALAHGTAFKEVRASVGLRSELLLKHASQTQLLFGTRTSVSAGNNY